MSVMSLYPYLKNNDYEKMLWVFDDEAAGLKSEAFVAGMSEMITAIVLEKGIPKAANGFKISFSDQPFGHDVELDWIDEETFQWEAETPVKGQPEPLTVTMAGNWYEGVVADSWMEGWLCPALLLYFSEAPAKLYVKAEPLPDGVDPIWHDAKLTGRRFVGEAVK